MDTATTTNAVNEENGQTLHNECQPNTKLAPPEDLLSWNEMPQHLQFNPYVHKGERLTAFT